MEQGQALGEREAVDKNARKLDHSLQSMTIQKICIISLSSPLLKQWAKTQSPSHRKLSRCNLV